MEPYLHILEMRDFTDTKLSSATCQHKSNFSDLESDFTNTKISSATY